MQLARLIEGECCGDILGILPTAGQKNLIYNSQFFFFYFFSEYTPDPERPPLKSTTVKSVIMLVFREGKTVEEEMKAWAFWHSRQHSVKQRILDADTKNSGNLIGKEIHK